MLSARGHRVAVVSAENRQARYEGLSERVHGILGAHRLKNALAAVGPEVARQVVWNGEEPEARNRVQGKILDIGYLGNLSTYHVELPDGQVIKCEVGNRSRLSRRDFTWEDEVWLSWTDTAGLVLPS